MRQEYSSYQSGMLVRQWGWEKQFRTFCQPIQFCNRTLDLVVLLVLQAPVKWNEEWFCMTWEVKTHRLRAHQPTIMVQVQVAHASAIPPVINQRIRLAVHSTILFCWKGRNGCSESDVPILIKFIDRKKSPWNKHSIWPGEYACLWDRFWDRLAGTGSLRDNR